QEGVERVFARRGAGIELAAHLDELLEVLDPALRLDRALGLQRLDVAGSLEQRLDQLADRSRPPARDILAWTRSRAVGCGRLGRRAGQRAQLGQRLHEAPQRLDGRGPEAGDLLGRGGGKIGRASCRERVESYGAAVTGR